MHSLRTRIITALGLALYTTMAASDEIQVKMLDFSKTQGPVAFEPLFVKANVNDTIVFVAVDPGHNTHSVFGPTDAQSWESRFDKEFRVTLDKEGIYLYICDAHRDLGMVGVVQVGKAVNLKEAEAKAAEISSTTDMQDRFANALKQVTPN